MADRISFMQKLSTKEAEIKNVYLSEEYMRKSPLERKNEIKKHYSKYLNVIAAREKKSVNYMLTLWEEEYEERKNNADQEKKIKDAIPGLIKIYSREDDLINMLIQLLNLKGKNVKSYLKSLIDEYRNSMNRNF